MKTEQARQYPSTRFTVLSDAESASRARKNYLICIIMGIIFICLTAAYLSYKTFIVSIYLDEETPESTNNSVTNHSKHPELKLYNPQPFLAGFRRKTSKDHRELTCEESQPHLEAIPAIFIREILEKNFGNIHDFVNLDLLLHYKHIINRNGVASLKATFNDYQLKLSLVKSSRDFLNFLRVLKSNKFKFYVNYLKGSLELKKFESIFALTDELNQWYNYLNRLDAFLASYEAQKERSYLVNCTKENFEKFTEDTQKRLFQFVYPFNITEKKLREINDVIKRWAEPVKIIFDNTSVVFHGEVLLLSELNREMRDLNTSWLKSAYFIASRSVFLDEDVELLGVNLAVMSPNWVFLKKTKINLNGPDGRNITESADFDQPGEPGKPGGNAGDFLGVGNPYEKYLLITSNGGRGGNGQNGAKGLDGQNNTLPEPPVNKPSCMTKGTSFNNTFGQVITHYKVYRNSACGSSGTDGGMGGQGGAGGTIILICKNSVKVKRGLNGTAGLPGKGGPGGTGGRNGCFYEVLDVNDKILHRVTRVKCLSGNILPNGVSGKDNHNTQGQVLPPVKESLNLHTSFLQFIRFTGGHFDSDTISLLKQLNQFDINNSPDVKDIILEYKIVETFDKIELYDTFLEKINKYKLQSIQPFLNYLKSILLGRITILKGNINYFLIDYKNFLNILRNDIKTVNENAREFQASIYLKRIVQVKIEQMIQNLKQIRLGLTAIPHKYNYMNCVMIMTIDVLQSLLETPNAIHLEINNLRSCWLNIRKRDTLKETNLLRILENVTEDVRGHLEKLKDALCTAKDSDTLYEREKSALEALTDEVEHFIALYYFVDWKGSENLFSKSLHDLTVNTDTDSEEIQFLKKRLVEVMVGVLYSLALGVSRQNVYPSNQRTTLVRFLQNKSLVEDVLRAITLLENDGVPEMTSFCTNHLKAVFDEKSAVGEFYFWPNANIRYKLGMLFSGAEIDLKSNLINGHVFDKNFVQFTSLKLQLECSRNGSVCQEELNRIMDYFKIEITHSGYSYYNWEGETRVFVSEKATLDYSFRMRDNRDPEIYNDVYKKCQDGEIKLSPFTTWTIRLLPIHHETNFKKLSPFVDFVNLRLIGSGTYIT